MPLLTRLRLLARQDADAPLPPGTAGEVGYVASAMVAEADAAVAAVAESSRRSAAVFPAARQAGMAAAAADVVAAKDGSAATLSRHLRRFEALTSAPWTVQDAICAPRPSPLARVSPSTGSLIRQPDCAPAAAGS